MTEKKVVTCPKCLKKISVPVGKHVTFTCPECNEKLEYNDRPECDIHQEQVNGNFTEEKKKLGCLGHIILLLATLIIAVPLIVGYYQYLMWIPIDKIEIRMLVIVLIFASLIYFIVYKFRRIAFSLLIIMLLKMGYNQYYNKRGLTYEKAIRSYLSLVEYTFENNPNLIQDVNEAVILSVENDLVSSIDYNSAEVKQFSNKASIKYFTENEDKLFKQYGNLIRYFSVFKSINERWKYVSDPANVEHYAKASESIESMAGDCDDYSILMSACVKSVGGSTRMVWVKEHVFPVVLVASDKYEFNLKVKPLLKKLFTDIYDDDFGVVQNEEGIWLSFDYTKNYPGGPFLNKEVIKLIKI